MADSFKNHKESLLEIFFRPRPKRGETKKKPFSPFGQVYTLSQSLFVATHGQHGA